MRRKAVGVILYALCSTAAILCLYQAASLGRQAYRYAHNIRAVRAVRLPLMEEADFLRNDLYTASDVVGLLTTVPAHRVILFVVAEACATCRDAMVSWSPLSNVAVGDQIGVLMATVSTGPQCVADCARLRIAGHPCVLVFIRSPERFRAVTGVVAVPTALLLDATGAVRAAVMGIPSHGVVDRFAGELSRPGSGALLIDYHGRSQPILQDFASLGQSDR